jgi:hypothetical protein
MEKSVVYLFADGSEVHFKKVPSFEKMRGWLGGYVELVRVLPMDAPEPLEKYLTYLAVDEEGRIKDLLKNDQATEIYHNLTKKQFPGVENPIRKARETFVASMPKGIFVVSSFYEEDPYIAGDAIYFQGYTCKELENIWNKEEE